MKNKTLKNIIWIYKYVLIYILLMTVFSYANILNYKILSVINYISVLTLSLILGIKSSRQRDNKGCKAGILTGIILVITFVVISLITKSNLNIKSVIYYGTLILTSTIGSIIGINTKK